MNNFPQPPTNHMGGIAYFEFIEVEGVAAMPNVLNHTITDALTINPGYSFANGYSSIDELEYDEKSKLSDDGKYFEARLKGFVPDSPDMIKTLAQMDGRRFIIRFIDNDLMKRLVGTLESPLTFSSDFETQTASGQKGHSYEFSGSIENRAPIYDRDDFNSSETPLT